MDVSKGLVFGALCVAFVGVFMAGAVLAPFGAEVTERSSGIMAAGFGGEGGRDGSWLGAGSDEARVARADSETEKLNIAEIRALEASAEIGAEAASSAVETKEEPAPLATVAITGSIRDVRGQPIAGVLLRARPTSENSWQDRQFEDMALWPRDGRAPAIDLQRMLRNTALQFARTEGRMRELYSDENGNYSIEGVTTEAWRIEAYAQGWKLRSAMNDNSRVWPGQRLDFTGERLVRVPIEVRNESEELLERACIDVEVQNESHNIQLWTREDPAIWIAPGTYRVRARIKPGKAPASEAVAVAVDPDQAPAPLRLVLHEDTTVVGMVRGEVLKQFGERAITIEFRDVGQAEQMDWYYDGGRRNRNVEMEHRDGELHYRATGLKPGKRNLRVRLANSVQLEDREVELPAGETRIDLDLALEAGSRVIEAVVMDGTGVPQLDASVSVQIRGDNRNSNERVAAVAAGNGRWFLVHSPKLLEKTNEWSFVAQARSSRLGQLQKPYKPYDDAEVEMRFELPAHLILRVANTPPKGLMVQVSLEPERRDPGDAREETPSAMLGDASEIALGPIRPGTYRLVVRGSQRDWNFFPLSEEPIEIRSGRQERVLNLPEVHSLKVRVADAEQGSNGRGSVWRADDPSSSFRTSFSLKDGVGEITGLPTGRYEAELQERGNGLARRESFSVPGTAELIFPPASASAAAKNAVRVEIQDASGRAATAGLAQGDLIIGIGGKRFENPEEITPRFSGAPYYLTGPTISLEIERGGAILRLDVDRDVLLYQRNSGARFRTPGR